MKLFAQKSTLTGSVPIPASKSHTIRGVAIASLADGTSTLRNPLISGDTMSAVQCYRSFGAEIDTSNSDEWVVTGTAGQITPANQMIDVNNSGTTLRIAAGSAALSESSRPIQLTGDYQIQARPIAPLLQSLTDLGAHAVSVKNNGMAPISVAGRLMGGETDIECMTSQYLTSLLIACPLAAGDSRINVTLLNEPDYAKMTLDWLDRQGILYENDNLRRIDIQGRQRYNPFDIQVPADFSSATFFLCAGAILRADITLTGLDFSDSQPDKSVSDYLERMGAEIRVDNNTVRIRRSPLQGIDIDMNRTPDALPAMAVVGAFAEGTTRLLNVPQARKKETDRIAVMAKELAKMGVQTEELPDGLVIHHCPRLKAAALNGHDDHRIVMALSLALMAIEEGGVIDTAEAINVTFPEYVNLMQRLGARMKLAE
jgi:3-phosphoshikimate 1-carboxyvinyltransferase